VKITAPDQAHLPGEFQTSIGATALTFHDGEAEYDGELSPGVQSYLLQAGYKLDGTAAKAARLESDDTPVGGTVDARDITTVQVGTPARDGAVDPRPEDFLAPVNAGEADPHGPEVVSPGIHAEGERVVAAGPVLPGQEQEATEKRLAEKLLVDNEPVSTPTGGDFKVENMGELGLSDPLSAAVGAELAEGQTGAELTADAHDERRDRLEGEPKGGAKRDEWVEFARSQGAPEEQLGELGTEGALTRDELRAQYGS
jgi:hypothetical protein